MQVSPTEIEETLLRHPEGLVVDVSVAGVSGGRTADERVPRAWVVLSPSGRALGAAEVAARLDTWVRDTLSRYKWLRGGIAIVMQVSHLAPRERTRSLICMRLDADTKIAHGQGLAPGAGGRVRGRAAIACCETVILCIVREDTKCCGDEDGRWSWG